MNTSKLAVAISTASLSVALFGVTPLGQAAARLVVPSNSVGAKQIKPNAVTGLKVKNGSLMAADFRPGQLPAGPQGPKGDAGAQGPAGSKGADEAPGLTHYGRVESQTVTIAPGDVGMGRATCQDGEDAIGGGIVSNTAGPTPIVTAQSYAVTDHIWEIDAVNTSKTKAQDMWAFAVCAKVTP